MTPDTLPIDRRFAGVGRIHRASGTADRVVRRRILKMLTALKDGARLDILRALRDGSVTFLEVLDAYTRNALQELPVGDTMPILSKAIGDWIDDAASEYSTDHVDAVETSRRYLEKADADARVADLPRLLERLRKSLGAKYPRSFNLLRAHALAFARSTLKKSHPIYLSCLAVEPRKVKRAAARVHLTPDAIRGFFPNPGAKTKEGKVDRIVWAMVTTGMGQKEYWGRWQTLRDRVHIAGTKRGGRVRDVPLIQPPAPPSLSRDRFEKLFRERMSDAGVTPYHLRRTYLQWLEAAGVPRARRRLYAGHGAKDVTDLYEAHEVTTFLAGDAEKVRLFLGLPAPDAPMKTGTMGIVK